MLPYAPLRAAIMPAFLLWVLFPFGGSLIRLAEPPQRVRTPDTAALPPHEVNPRPQMGTLPPTPPPSEAQALETLRQRGYLDVAPLAQQDRVARGDQRQDRRGGRPRQPSDAAVNSRRARLHRPKAAWKASGLAAARTDGQAGGGSMKSCAAPDPDTRRPRFVPPPHSCDAHCHVFGPAAVFPYAPERSYTPPDAPKQSLAALHRLLGIERAVIVQASCHGRDNRAMLDAVAASPDRHRGIAMLADDVSEADLAALHAGGVRGVRFNFVRHLGGAPDPRVFRRVIERIEPLGWHVILHLDAADILELGGLLRGLRLAFVIDHMRRVNAADGLAQPPFRALLELMALGTCWVKLCGAERISAAGPPFHDAIPFAAALLAAAPDRVLWGTDWPHPNIARHMPNDGDLVDLLPLIAPDAAMRQKLLVDNPQLLYWS
ncbi:MAG: amidohydrolase family protein [Stellaceae bacterium]